MTSRTEFLSITPLMPAGPSLVEALSFYTAQMGFTVDWQGTGMAGIRRDGIEINLVESSDQHWADNASCSIGVRDLDALYAEYRDVPAKVGPLEEKAWGRREFHLIVPFGVCFQFYQCTKTVRDERPVHD